MNPRQLTPGQQTTATADQQLVDLCEHRPIEIYDPELALWVDGDGSYVYIDNDRFYAGCGNASALLLGTEVPIRRPDPAAHRHLQAGDLLQLGFRGHLEVWDGLLGAWWPIDTVWAEDDLVRILGGNSKAGGACFYRDEEVTYRDRVHPTN